MSTFMYDFITAHTEQDYSISHYVGFKTMCMKIGQPCNAEQTGLYHKVGT